MLVQVDHTLTSSRNSLPVAVERYDDELREYFDSERGDGLNFRIADSKKDHRFYRPRSRVDFVKEAIFDVSGSGELEVVFEPGRPDAMLRYSRKLVQSDEESGKRSSSSSSSPLSPLKRSGGAAAANSASRPVAADGDEGAAVAAPTDARAARSNMTYRIEYDVERRPQDGLRSVSLALRSGERIDVSHDCAASVFGCKALYLALSCHPDVHPGHVLEVHQDQAERMLRLTVEDQSTLLGKTRFFRNDEPNNDPLYESNKVLLMNSLVKVLTMERELFLNLPALVDVDAQKEQLEKLTVGLFGALDANSPPVQL